jgi:hypothetical protein
MEALRVKVGAIFMVFGLGAVTKLKISRLPFGEMSILYLKQIGRNLIANG